MLLLIEIALTLWAWRKGWKAWALLPGGILLTMGFVIGAACVATGADPSGLAFLVIGDLAGILVLAVMVARGRRSNVGTQAVPQPDRSSAYPCADTSKA